MEYDLSNTSRYFLSQFPRSGPEPTDIVLTSVSKHSLFHLSLLLLTHVSRQARDYGNDDNNFKSTLISKEALASIKGLRIVTRNFLNCIKLIFDTSSPTLFSAFKLQQQQLKERKIIWKSHFCELKARRIVSRFVWSSYIKSVLANITCSSGINHNFIVYWISRGAQDKQWTLKVCAHSQVQRAIAHAKRYGTISLLVLLLCVRNMGQHVKVIKRRAHSQLKISQFYCFTLSINIKSYQRAINEYMQQLLSLHLLLR